jgi:hypothetical protein
MNLSSKQSALGPLPGSFDGLEIHLARSHLDEIIIIPTWQAGYAFTEGKMSNKRVFVAFAIEDKTYRDFLVGQAKHDKSPFEFIDMSVKEPWDTKWKTNCRSRVKSCDGVVALISKNTAKADGALWEIECAYDEKVPTMLMWINDERPVLPHLIKDKRVNVWSWLNLKAQRRALSQKHP